MLTLLLLQFIGSEGLWSYNVLMDSRSTVLSKYFYKFYLSWSLSFVFLQFELCDQAFKIGCQPCKLLR